MANPYLLMTVFYLTLAILAALDSALANLGIVPWYNGLIWLRVHFITLGAFVEAVFGMLPILVAARARRPRPAARWDIWLALNTGLVILSIAIPLVDGPLTVAGGTLVLIAAILLFKQLLDLSPLPSAFPPIGTPSARGFYISGLAYLLLGAFVGTGYFVGWNSALGMVSPRDVHIHANLWGFTSLVFAGLWIDLYPVLTGRGLAWPRTLKWVLVLMTLGDLGLVLGPWTGVNPISGAGLLLHFVSTLLLLGNILRPLLGDRSVCKPGLVHMVLAYAWVVIPALMGPLLVFSLANFPAAAVETIAPPMMIYGWLLQFGYGLFPFLLSRTMQPEKPPHLGGNVVSLVGVNLGAALILAAAFFEPLRATLSAIAFLLWTVSTIPIVLDLWRIARVGLARIEQRETPAVDIL